MTKYIRLLRHERIERLKFKYVDPVLISDLKSYDPSQKNYIVRTMSRSSTITPLFVGKMVAIYNGKKYFSLEITEDFLGHKLGEFIFTRKFLGHKKQGKKLVIKKKINQNRVPFKNNSKLVQPFNLYELKKFFLNPIQVNSKLFFPKQQKINYIKNSFKSK